MFHCHLLWEYFFHITRAYYCIAIPIFNFQVRINNKLKTQYNKKFKNINKYVKKKKFVELLTDE